MPRGWRWREGLGDVVGRVVIGRTKLIQRVRDLPAQFVGPHLEHVARDDRIATGQRDEQRRRAGAYRHRTVVGDVESAATGFGDPHSHRRESRGV